MAHSDSRTLSLTFGRLVDACYANGFLTSTFMVRGRPATAKNRPQNRRRGTIITVQHFSDPTEEVQHQQWQCILCNRAQSRGASWEIVGTLWDTWGYSGHSTEYHGVPWQYAIVPWLPLEFGAVYSVGYHVVRSVRGIEVLYIHLGKSLGCHEIPWKAQYLTQQSVARVAIAFRRTTMHEFRGNQQLGFSRRQATFRGTFYSPI